jgi:hypothetical protein
MLTNRIFRLFVSSTFSDFIAERAALQTVVFPELEEYCAKRGARFLAVDLRWGITEEAQREHDTMRICLEEVRRCQRLSPRPNFAVLLGDRYGWEPVPARIPQDHWRRLMKAATPADSGLIKDSYELDENAVPPVYCLPERAPDLTDALQHEANLLQALRRAARGFRGSARLPYFASATHQEIALGALLRRDEKRKPLHPEQHVHVYVRHLSGLPQDESAKDFIDWDASIGQPVLGARERLHGLETQLRRQLGDHVHDLHTNWSRHGQNGAVNKAYLKRFCDAFLSHQKFLIDAEFDSLRQADECQLREQAHQDFGAERARVFAGRHALLAKIARYTETAPEARATRTARKKSQAAPLILLGGGGSGKSALLARAAQESVHQAERSGAIVLQRYIGGVPGAESLMTTLTGLTADIASLYGQPEPPTPENAKTLAGGFQAALGHATAGRPLILYLDALDQLDQSDSAWMLEWLPKELPEHVHVVTSVRTDTNVEHSARRRYPKNLIEVPAMNPAEGRAMLSAWLADKRAAWFNAGIAPSTGRRLTLPQVSAILDAFNVKGSALWLKLAYEEASTWRSSTPPRQLPESVQGLIEDLVDNRLMRQENHPQAFTERALAYLTAGRFGLSEGELSRALGTDQVVRAEFQANEKTQTKWEDDKQLPPILWSRLFFDLQPYLGLAQVDGAILMRWFHREFAEVLKARYLANPEDRQGIHRALADTFLHLERELRPHEANDDALFRATDESGKQVSAALRRLMEQPWQLAQAGRHEALQELLTDFGFCMGKCAANRSIDLVLDWLAFDSKEVRDEDAESLKRFLRTRLHVLQRGERKWPAHRILLQLATDFGQKNPVTRSARRWMALSMIDWPRLEKVVFLPEISRDGVEWVAFDHAHRDGKTHRDDGKILDINTGRNSGVRYDNGNLWSWDPGHLCHWDIATGQALYIEPLLTESEVVPLGGLALIMARDIPRYRRGHWDSDKGRLCVLYDPTTGRKLWEKRCVSPLRDAYPVGDDAVAVVSWVATDLLSLSDGTLRRRVPHDVSKLPRSRWGAMEVRILAQRWVAYYQCAPCAQPDQETLATTANLAIYDIQQDRVVFADAIDGLNRQSHKNPSDLRMERDILLIWTGRWWALNIASPELGLRDIEADLCALLQQAGQNPVDMLFRDGFVPLGSNRDHLIFRFRVRSDNISSHLLVAWNFQSGRVIHREIDEKLTFAWSSSKLVVIGEYGRHFIWCLDDDSTESLRLPVIDRPVLLTAHGDVLVLSSGYTWGMDEGYLGKPDPLVAHNIQTGNSTVFYFINRVIHGQSMFRHTWLDTGELVVIDGDYLVCLRVDQGVPWSDYVETSFGSMLTVVEDCRQEGQYAIVGTRRLMHMDLAGPSPSIESVAHPCEFGAICELAGDDLLIWEDDNERNSQGNFGRFGLWRRDTMGKWHLDPATFVENLLLENNSFNPMRPYAMARVGGDFLVGQAGVVFCFGLCESGYLELRDTLRGPFNAETIWIRGETLYFPDAEDDAVMHAAAFSCSLFGPPIPIARSSLLQEGEVAFMNVRPFRDMSLGPLRGSRLFAVGEPVDGWTVLDGALESQARHHISLTGPEGLEARWYGRRDCRILRHRIDFTKLPGRDLFDFFRAEGEVHSLVLDGRIYFVCEEDGSAWLVKLIMPESPATSIPFGRKIAKPRKRQSFKP